MIDLKENDEWLTFPLWPQALVIGQGEASILLRGCLEAPVIIGELVVVGNQHQVCVDAILIPSLNEEDLPLGDLREPVGDHTATDPRAHNDEIVLIQQFLVAVQRLVPED